MYLRIYWSRIVPESWPEVEERYRQLAAAEVPGRLARWVTQDANDPESVITVTFWDTRESVDRWEGSEQHEAAINAMKPFLVGTQTVSLCKVMLENPENLLEQLAGAGPGA